MSYWRGENLKMFLWLSLERGTEPKNARELLTVMEDKKLISPHDVIFLQALLWAVGKKDVFKQVAEYVKKIHGRPRNQRKIAHLDVPRLQPGMYFHRVNCKVDWFKGSECKCLHPPLLFWSRLDLVRDKTFCRRLLQGGLSAEEGPSAVAQSWSSITLVVRDGSNPIVDIKMNTLG